MHCLGGGGGVDHPIKALKLVLTKYQTIIIIIIIIIMILLSEMENRKIFLPNWSWARQPLSSARSTLLYPFQMLNAKQGSSNSHLLTSFGMTRPGIEPTTSRLWGGRSTDWANTHKTMMNTQLHYFSNTITFIYGISKDISGHFGFLD